MENKLIFNSADFLFAAVGATLLTSLLYMII